MHPVDRFRESFANFDPATPFPVEQIYAPDVTFEDPAHRIDGREALAAYFARLNRNLKAVRFTFHHDVRGDSVAALSWTMELRLRVGPRRPVVVPGSTWVEHDGQLVTSQRDHFDLGAMLYEQVPVLGTLVRTVRRAL